MTFRRTQTAWLSLLLLLVVAAQPALALDDDSPGDDDPVRPDFTEARYRQAVDFRDLFLTPEESMELGGSGLQPYGNIFRVVVWPLISDLENKSLLKDALANATEDQSGVAGSIILNSTYDFSFDIDGTDLNITISQVQVTGLDNVEVHEVFQPTDHPHVLSNSLTFYDLEATLRLQIVLDGDTPLTTVNETLDITLTIPQATISFDLWILLDARALYDFPINDLVSLPCWLNIFMDTQPYAHDAIELQNLQIEFSSIILTVTCYQCSPMLDDFLPRLMGTLQGSIQPTDHNNQSSTNTIVAANDTLVVNRIEHLLEDGVYNVWRLLDIFAVTQQLATLCHSHPDYNPNITSPHDLALWGLNMSLVTSDLADATMANWNATTSIQLSRDSFATLMAAAVVAIQTGVVLVGQKYLDAYPNGTAWVDPLTFVPPPETADNYLNWTDLGLYPLLQLGLDSVHNISTTLVNNLMRDNFLQDDGGLVIPLDQLDLDTGLGHTITLDQIVVFGLDSVTHLSLLVPLTAFQLRSTIQLEYLAVEAHVQVSSDYYSTDAVQMRLEGRQIGIVVDLLLPIELEVLGNMPIGGLLQNEFKCLFAAAPNATFTQLHVTMGEIEPATIWGNSSQSLQQMGNTLGHNLLRDYEADLLRAVPIMFQTTVLPIVNDLFRSVVDDVSEICPVVVPTPPGFVDFQKLFLEVTPYYGQVFSDLYTYVSDTFFNAEGVERINGVIARSTADGLDFLTEIGANVSAEIPIGNVVVDATGQVANVSLDNLDSLGLPFRVLWPAEPHRLENNVTMGADDSETNESQPLTVSADLFFAATDGKNMNIQNRLSISLGLTEIKIFADILLKIAEVFFLNFPLKAAVDVNCWFFLIPPKQYNEVAQNSNLPGVSVDGQVNYTNAIVDINCTSCSSPLLPEMIQRLYRIGEESSELIIELINRILSGKFLGNALNNVVSDSQGQCKYLPEDWQTLDQKRSELCGTNASLPTSNITIGSGNWTEDGGSELKAWALTEDGNWTAVGTMLPGNYTPDDLLAVGLCQPYDEELWVTEAPKEKNEEEEAVVRDPNAKFFNIAFGSFSALVLFSFMVARIYFYYKNKTWMESMPPQGVRFLEQLQEHELERDGYLDDTMSSLYQSMFLPRYIRLAVPVILVLNMCCFVVAHLAITATISVAVNFGGEYFMIDNLFEFRFADALRATFENGGYEMAILLLIFGGVWPYLRCIVSLILWFTPPQHLSAAFRGKMFLCIDAMNKLTVRDIFKFMVILAVIFIFLGGPFIFSEGVGDLYSVTILAWPGPALYCGITAVIVSRVTSRWLLDCHLKALDGAREAYHKDRIATSSKATHQTHLHTFRDDATDDKISLQNPINVEKTEQHLGKEVVDETPGIDIETRDGMDESEAASSSNLSSAIPLEITVAENRSITICGREILLGNLAVALAVFTALLMLLVGLVFIPAVSINLASILELIFESGTTYEEAISTFGVYALICAVLLKTRLALESVWDFVAVTLLLVLGIVALSFTWVVGTFRWFHDLRINGWRRLYPTLLETDGQHRMERNLVMMPSYLRLKATQHSTVLVVAYVIGIYQLGAVTIYAIHYFCTFLDTIYGALAFVGIIKTTSGECWEAQMGQLHNLLVFCGCFLYLTFCFVEQIVLQRKFNIAQARKFLQEVQEERAYQIQLEQNKLQDQLVISHKVEATVKEGEMGVLTSTTMSDSEARLNVESTNGDCLSAENVVDGQTSSVEGHGSADPRDSSDDESLRREQTRQDSPLSHETCNHGENVLTVSQGGEERQLPHLAGSLGEQEEITFTLNTRDTSKEAPPAPVAANCDSRFVLASTARRTMEETPVEFDV